MIKYNLISFILFNKIMSKLEIKKMIPLIILFILAIGLIWMMLKKDTQATSVRNSITSSSTLVLYTSKTCPHCQLVKEYMQRNQISEKITITVKDVVTSLKNQDDLVAKAKICKLDTKKLGIPLLFDGQNCYSGDTDIINYFEILK